MNTLTNRRIFHQIHGIFSLISVISNHSIFFLVQHSLSRHISCFSWTRSSDFVRDHPILLCVSLPSIMELSSSSSWLVMLSWILAHLLWTLLTWIFDQSGASRKRLHSTLSTTILLIIPRKFSHSMKLGSNQLTDNFVPSLAPPGYSILHSPRLTGQGGGFALISRSYLKFKLFRTLHLTSTWIFRTYVYWTFNPRTPRGVDATPLAFFPCNFFMIQIAKIASAYLLLGMGDTFWHMWRHLDAVTWHMSWRHMYMTVVKIHCFYHCLLIKISFDVDAIKWWGWCRFQLN